MNNPQAFPLARTSLVYESGMTLRDYFAGQALIGILSKSFGENMVADACDKAFEYADAMLRAREAK